MKKVSSDELFEYKNDFEYELKTKCVLEAYGTIVYPQNVYKASEKFTTRQLQGLCDWYKMRLKTINNPAMSMVKALIDHIIQQRSKKS